MRSLPLIFFLAACSSTLTTFDDKVTPAVDGTDTGEFTGDDDDDVVGDDDDVVGDDDDVVGDDDDVVGDDDDDTTIPQNQPPVAIGDPATQTVPVFTMVTLDASGSYDPDGDPLSYEWTLNRVAGSGANMIGANDVEAQFAPDREGTYTVDLVVDDGFTSDATVVEVIAELPNDEPVANAGATQRVPVGTIVSVSGAASYDPNGDPLTYQWMLFSQPAGSSAVLSSTTAVNPTFQADVVGDYLLGLQVNDGSLTSQRAEVRIIAEPEDTTGDGDSCFSCAQANLELERRLSVGDAAGGFGLVLLPLIVLLAQRREED